MANPRPGSIPPESNRPVVLVTEWVVNWVALVHRTGSRR